MGKIILLGIFVLFTFLFIFILGKNDQKSNSKSISKEDDVEQIKTECRNQKYRDLAMQSLKLIINRISPVTNLDLLNPNPLKAYLNKSKDLCNLLLSNHELQITEWQNYGWTYRFILTPGLMGNSMAYGLVFYNDHWRFILPESARI